MKIVKLKKIALFSGACLILAGSAVLITSALTNIFGNKTSSINNSSSQDEISKISVKEYDVTPLTDNTLNMTSQYVNIHDMGFITNISDMLWLDDIHLIIIGISEDENGSYMWIFDNDTINHITEEKAIISLNNEQYSSATLLDNGNIVIATTKRLIYLNDELQETRSLMFSPKNNSVTEATVSNDGKSVIYQDNTGLYYKELESKNIKLIISNNKIGEGSMPYNSYFCNNKKIGFHYITSDLKLYCGISDINGNYSIFNQDSHYLTYITDKNIMLISKDNPSKLMVIDTVSKNELHYNFTNFIPLSLIAQDDKIYICGTNSNGTIYSVNTIDINQDIIETKLSVYTDNMSFGGFTAVSPSGKIATERYSSSTDNTKILIAE